MIKISLFKKMTTKMQLDYFGTKASCVVIVYMRPLMVLEMERRFRYLFRRVLLYITLPTLLTGGVDGGVCWRGGKKRHSVEDVQQLEGEFESDGGNQHEGRWDQSRVTTACKTLSSWSKHQKPANIWFLFNICSAKLCHFWPTHIYPKKLFAKYPAILFFVKFCGLSVKKKM